MWRQNSGRRPGVILAPRGTPDIIGYHRHTGRMIAIEVKARPGDALSEDQIRFRNRAVHAGVYWCCVRHFSMFEQWCKREGL